MMAEPVRKPEPVDYATFRQQFPRGVELVPAVIMLLSILVICASSAGLSGGSFSSRGVSLARHFDGAGKFKVYE